MSLQASVGGGYYYGLYNQDPGIGDGNPFVTARLGASFKLMPSLGLGITGYYRNYFGLYNYVGVSLVTTVYLGSAEEMPKPLIKEQVTPESPKPEPFESEEQAPDGEGVGLVRVQFENIFPVFYKYYNSNPIGSAIVRNFGNQPAEDIRVTFFVKQYMDNPKEASAIDALEPGEEKEIDIFGLFTNDVLEITEGTIVSALVNVSYKQNGKQESKEFIESIRLQNRNAVTWDDNRKACSFVTAKDPAVMKFSKNVAGWIQGAGQGAGPRAVAKNLKLAIALHEALDLYGISYVVDPITPYVEFSENEFAIDFLQFPKQTLEYLAGDCDDLSILYSSLLEAAGIETAFVTTPGHIFTAFSLGMSPDEARDLFLYPDELIFRNGKTWLPVEITVRREGFIKAWETGAKEWRENVAEDLAGFYEMHAAWKVYEPVGFPGTVQIDLPDRKEILAAYERTLEAFVEKEMGPQLTRIQNELSMSQGDSRWANRLGVLYARYGQDEKALAEFQKILEKENYLPALLNIGNIYYLRGELEKARNYYLKAQEIAPGNAKVLLAVARVDHDLENYGTARTAYRKLQEIDPGLAARFSYLDLRGDEAQRAAEAAGVREVLLWEEE
jgi:tetratricopeptide (TPR) repeat protein